MPVQRKYLEMFLEEGAEIVSKLNQRILALEAGGGDPETLQSALRLAHTLKGGAKMVGLDNVSEAAHSMENALKALGPGETSVPASECTRFLGLLDRIGWALELVASGQEGEALALDLSAPVGAPASPGPSEAACGQADEGAEGARKAAGPIPAGAAPAAPERRLGADRVRVSVGRLDALQHLVDDLFIQKGRIFEHMAAFRAAFKGLERLGWDGDRWDMTGEEARKLQSVVRLLTGRGFAAFLEDLHGLDQICGEMQTHLFELRMVPVAEVLEEYQRTVRDLARELGKEVTLAIDGKFTEMDKRILDEVQAPLMHLVRNAVDHGIESPEQRQAAGKPRPARVTIRAYHKGAAVVLEVEDDGRGLDPERIRAKAVERGLIGPEEAAALPDEEVYFFLCEPGFTTREVVTQVSGRGVGLDVVKARLDKLKGSLSIQSERGRFTRFRMFLPLSVSALSALVVRAGEWTFALPSLFVDRCLRVAAAELEEQGGTVVHQGRALPVVSLARVLGLASEVEPSRALLVVLKFRSRFMVLQVDALVEEREVVLKPLGAHLGEVPHLLGVSFLGHGEPVPVLNVAELHARWPGLEASARYRPGAVARPPSVLVVDDSVTTRHLERNVLESLGYRVTLAADGAQAWQLLQDRAFDLVVTDVEMPHMDGLELSRRIRAHGPTADLPVVVVSNRTGDEDREAGFLAGVDAYIGKDRFSQRELGETLRGLLDRKH
ncbi:MAG: Wsp signal transduction system sensor histidine kinase WspE [Deferrisomatales bacterium]